MRSSGLVCAGRVYAPAGLVSSIALGGMYPSARGRRGWRER